MKASACITDGKEGGRTGLWVILGILGFATGIAGGWCRAPASAVALPNAEGPAFVQLRDAAGGAVVVALPAGFLAMLDGRSFRPGAGGRSIVGWMDGATLVALGVPVPVNQATEADLAAIPGVSRRTAAAIVAARASDGPFASWEDLDAVRGVGKKTLEILRGMGRL